MSKMSKAIAVLGVVAGLGVAAMPLSSYAATSANTSAQVQAEVTGSISVAIVDPTAANTNDNTNATLTLANDGSVANLNLGRIIAGGDVATGNLGVEVTTNDPLGYQLTISPVNASSTAMVGSTGAEIPAGSPTPHGENSAWGFKVAGEGAWKSFTKDNATPVILVDSGETTTDGDSNTTKDKLQSQTDVTFGVNAKSTQLEGTYVGTAVFTATVK